MSEEKLSGEVKGLLAVIVVLVIMLAVTCIKLSSERMENRFHFVECLQKYPFEVCQNIWKEVDGVPTLKTVEGE